MIWVIGFLFVAVHCGIRTITQLPEIVINEAKISRILGFSEKISHAANKVIGALRVESRITLIIFAYIIPKKNSVGVKKPIKKALVNSHAQSLLVNVLKLNVLKFLYWVNNSVRAPIRLPIKRRLQNEMGLRPWIVTLLPS